ncbi:hypothetical protein CVN68_02965 [Sphingomonas psychrotolerans]|uniref:YcaO domain-containing protein n=2 Tax=Sphingomonas psychrotolerans TaxID=1327635 RepID=A0A2K8MKI1_9SPHN|nr:hypothetical protein CVN68_02965 [Sphingomonas psychrotolerans]
MRAPEETLAAVRPHFGAMGITRIANITGLDRIGLPVVLVCRPNSRSLSTSVGKGLDLVNATVSGVMESIELHHGERVMQPLLLASAADLSALGKRIVDVSRLPRVRNGRYHPSLPLLWIEGFDLIGRKPAWLPFETVHASALSEAPTGSGCFAATSNGLASGNHLLEAMVHATLEVIERDSASLWSAGGQAHREDTAVDLDTVADPSCRYAIDRCRAAGVLPTVYDIGSDIGVPAYLCEIREVGPWQTTPVFSGLGCHFEPRLALLRAVTEAVQSRLVLIAGSRDDLSRRDYVAAGHAPSNRAIRLFPGETVDVARRTFNEDLADLAARLQRIGIDEAIAVDLTSTRYRIPVVRMVIPGLEGPDDDPEYAPGSRALALRERVS